MAPGREKKEVNVKVIVRARPPNSEERASRNSGSEVVTANSASNEVTVVQSGQGGKTTTKRFHFDQVHGPASTQQEVFDSSIAGVVDEVLQGFNCTVFAYGQTGTGKTYTMEGGRDEERWTIKQDTDGVIPRAVRRIFEKLNKNDAEYNVRVSFLELYNEELSDLIAPGEVLDGTTSSASGKKLKIFEDPSGRRGQIVQGLEEVCVTGVPDVMALLDKSSQRRRVAETLMNKHSSRSHSIFTIVIHIKETTSDGEELLKIGKLNLVDLAGSECIGRSGALNQRAKEAGMINQSLLTLGRVITALVDHTPHIPYRESKLTRLLQDSLGGKTKTCIIATISPCQGSIDETLSTLDYAYRARNIKNKPTVNQRMTKKSLIREYTQEIATLTAMLSAAREKNGVYIPHEKYAEMEAAMASRGVQVEALEAELTAKVKKLTELNKMFETTKEQLETETAAHTETKGVLVETEETLAVTETDLAATTDTLVASTADLEGTFAKIDRFGRSEDRTFSQADLFRRDACQQLSSLAGAVEAFGAAHQRSVSGLRGTVDTLADAHARGTEDINAAIAAIASFAEDALRIAREASASQAAEASGALDGASGAADRGAADVTAAADAMQTALAERLAALKSAAESQRRGVEAARQAAMAHAASIEESAARLAETHNEAVQRLTGAVDAHRGAVEEIAARARENAANLENQAREKADRLAESLIEEFSARVRGMGEAFAEDAAAAAAITAGAAGEAEKAAATIAGDAQGLAGEVTRIITEGTATFVQDTNTARDEIDTPLAACQSSVDTETLPVIESSLSGVAESRETIATASAEFSSAVRNVRDHHRSAQDIRQRSLDTAHASAGSEIKERTDAATAAANGVENDTFKPAVERIVAHLSGEPFEEVEVEVESVEAPAETAEEGDAEEGSENEDTEDVAPTVATVTKKVPIDGALAPLCNAHVGAAAEGISSLVGRIDTFAERELARLAPTGSTPVKREWVIPAKARTASKARKTLGEISQNKAEISQGANNTVETDDVNDDDANDDASNAAPSDVEVSFAASNNSEDKEESEENDDSNDGSENTDENADENTDENADENTATVETAVPAKKESAIPTTRGSRIPRSTRSSRIIAK